VQVTFNTRINHELAQWLDAHSKATGIPKAQIIGKLLEDYKKLVDSKNA
jgi:predicted DNA-binding protein